MSMARRASRTRRSGPAPRDVVDVQQRGRGARPELDGLAIGHTAHPTQCFKPFPERYLRIGPVL
jgi:hypothetical protein